LTGRLGAAWAKPRESLRRRLARRLLSLSPVPSDEPWKRAFSGILSDTLDDLGQRSCMLSPAFRPLEPRTRAYGCARTILLAPLAPGDDPDLVHGGLALLDTVRAGDFIVVAGGSPDWAYWGELMSTAARARRASGTLVDGMSRDSHAVRELGYAVFARGWFARDIKGRGKVAAIDVPVTVDGVAIAPGQLVFADDDGIVVVPPGLEATLAARVTRNLSLEGDVKAGILAGTKPSELVRTFGVF
jgi:regulator of RNase E activity RraA